MELDDRQQPVANMETSNDITDRKRRREEIERLNQALASSNRELEAFAYSVSHDLRAPLRHSAGYAELLQKHAASALDEKSRRYVQTILDASKRMGTLIDDLLSLSRIELNAHVRPEKAVDLVATVRQVTDAMQTLARDRGVEIVFHLAALVAIPYSYAAPASFIETNVVGTLNVLEAVRRAGCARLVHTSTSEVYGSPDSLPIQASPESPSTHAGLESPPTRPSPPPQPEAARDPGTSAGRHRSPRDPRGARR